MTKDHADRVAKEIVERWHVDHLEITSHHEHGWNSGALDMMDAISQALLAHSRPCDCREAKFKALIDQTQLLMDLQNGPPLLKYKDEWNKVMDDLRRTIKELET